MQLPEKQKAILRLLADGKFHSGTELAASLNISRSAIWKHVNSISELGLSCNAISGKGYRLERPLEFLEKNQILNAISESAYNLIAFVEIFDQIDSTNSYLAERCLDNSPSGSVCFAEQQTAGKGRRGRHWISPYGSNIYMSLLWRFQASPMTISGLSLAIGVAVIRALKLHFNEKFDLKWPNDIYHHNQKLGGILVEVTGESEGPCAAVIGIGLNLYLSDTNATTITQEWTDLSRITGRESLPRNAIAGTLLNEIIPVTAEFENAGITAYLDEWRSYDCLKDKAATLFIGQHKYEGIVKGIDDQGMLLLAHPDSTIQAFGSGEISFSKDPS